jgi:2-(1,2-epoxy-1,2-dihydrophenyl)acetyl-CoA isomerase
MQPFLDYEQEDGVAILTMNRPNQRNALVEYAQFQEFVDVCEKMSGDLSVRAVILTGRGPAFCAGGDIKAMRERSGIFAGSTAELRDNYRKGVQRVSLVLYNLEIPTIAAVNGPAIGAGCDLACMCDIRIASETAVFAEAFVQLGMVAGDGGAWLLQRAVGLSKACEMTFTGDPINAQEALACGLASRVVAPEALLDEARALAKRIARNPSAALRMSKRLIRESQHARLDTVLEMSAGLQAIAQHSEDHMAALEKLSAKMSTRRKRKD